MTYTHLPVGTYTFEVKAVDRDLNYSAPVAVDVEVYHQAFASGLRLEAVHLQDLFASFYRTYAEQPIGTARVVNDEGEAREATLRFELPGLTRQPFEAQLNLAPQSAQVIDLKAQLTAAILQAEETRLLQAEVEVEFVADQIVTLKEKLEITLYGRGALRWDQVGRAAAFITSTDPAVVEFARSPLVEFETEIKVLGKPGKNLLQAMLLFEALRQHGVRYLSDANTPYTQASADAAVVDYIQYPAETLQQKAGDCDDLTVLYCSLLENAGVSTALIDYPGHIFLLFDTGVARQEGSKAKEMTLDIESFYWIE